MDAKRKKRLEAAGWRVGSTVEFLGRTDAESEITDMRRTRRAGGVMTKKAQRKIKSPALKAIHSSASALLKVGAISKATMRKNFDFSNAKRGAVLFVSPGKTRITIRLDDDVIAWFHQRVNDAGGGNYHTLINQALRQLVDAPAEPIEDTLRRVIRVELRRLAPVRRRT